MKKIPYTIFSNNALYTIAKDLIALIENSQILTMGLGVEVFMNLVKIAFTNFQNALMRNATDPLTVAIDNADQLRDASFIAFKKYLEACLYSQEEGWQQAAQQINNSIERYGKELYKYGYAEETAALKNLLKELTSEPLLSSVSKLEGTRWVDSIKTNQTNFENLVLQRASVISTNNNTLADSRKPLVIGLRNLLNMIDLQQQATNKPELTILVEQINNLIAKDVSSVRISNSLADNKSVEEPSVN